MSHVLLTYTLAPDYLARRPQFRAEHLALAGEAAARGELLLAGAVRDEDGDGLGEAALLFTGESAAAGLDAARAFAAADPYVTNALVTAWRVREWVTVVGAGIVPPGGHIMKTST